VPFLTFRSSSSSSYVSSLYVLLSVFQAYLYPFTISKQSRRNNFSRLEILLLVLLNRGRTTTISLPELLAELWGEGGCWRIRRKPYFRLQRKKYESRTAIFRGNRGRGRTRGKPPLQTTEKKKVGTSSTGACATWQWLDYWMNLSSVYLSSELILIDTQTVYRPGVL